MPGRLSAIRNVAPQLLASAELSVDTDGVFSRAAINSDVPIPRLW